MADTILMLAVILMLLAVLFGALRLIFGPTTVDRVIAIDLLTIVSMSLIVVVALVENRFIYVDVAIVYALLSFLGVLAVARYKESKAGL